MNYFVWAVWAAQGSKEKKVDLSFSEQLLRVVFSTFLGQKKIENIGRDRGSNPRQGELYHSKSSVPSRIAPQGRG